MLRRILRLCLILLISNTTPWIFMLMIYFIQSASPIPVYLIERTKSNEVVSTENRQSNKQKLLKNISFLSGVEFLVTKNYIELNNEKERNFTKVFRRKLFSTQLQSDSENKNSDKEVSNKTNVKNDSMEIKIKSGNSGLQRQKKILNDFTNNEGFNLGKENNASHIKQMNNNKAHLSTFENYTSSLNASNQSITSPLLEDNSLTVDILSSGINNTLLNDSIINMTTLSDFEIIPTKSLINNLSSINNDETGLTSGAIAGVVIAVLIAVLLLIGIVIYILYQKCGRKTKLESKCPSDNCGYVDDTLRSSGYLNSHIELPKESSEEMTSLDNDSFLNSLESMTFQNYWADNTKNTKV
ncbi:uncharacterized protein LOC111630236 isoform X1 [Centruroides sculpturatus]|uniref:uncharacterized protein LOC111630236 isoform X1 n=1 Tax=Centruroides sculpturatus TaxID=218467 RepID=UPI000C6E9999|nr:uncharacterized protein LOC111630236 isoform X1 [Centruroides sculpturatus]XP_023230073.1 uncharacterized protein LOC111630236 isoform X1 [Centruroides sculpturatus]XP_023230074.1 uncharacterized protein LOC111630236 isoform X1 [Centruroides sculpturatus]XP_023230075.1 uncharacterized protein LOC111630236 isoform X1 [Centruroides sculpturatus]